MRVGREVVNWLKSRSACSEGLQRELLQILQPCEPPPKRSASVDRGSIECWNSLDSRDMEGMTLFPQPTWDWFKWEDGRCIGGKEPFAQITKAAVIAGFECDIREVEGVGASKSSLTEFATLDEFALAKCRNLVSNPNLERLRANLGHEQGKIRRDGFFSCSLWDGRPFWINSGSSHHFAAARFIAGQLGVAVRLCKDLHVAALNDAAVDTLTAAYDMFAMAAGTKRRFSELMCKHRVSHGFVRYPRPLDTWWIVLLPKSERGSAVSAECLQKARLMDVGGYLRDLCRRQFSAPASMRAAFTSI